MKTGNKSINASMQVFYILCRLALDLCLQHIADFAAFKSKYTAAYIADCMLAVDNAQKLKDVRRRNAGGKKARSAAEASAALVCTNFQALKRYISDAFPAPLEDIMLEMAGAHYYEKAAAFNWSSVQSLINAAGIFINEHLVALTGNGHMPAAFATKFSDDSNKCLILSAAFFNTDREKSTDCSDKHLANEAIHTELMKMLNDGKEIFKKNKALRSQLSFRSLKFLAKGHSVAGIRGYIINSVTGLPIEGVTLSTADGKYEAVTNKKGRYNIGQILGATTYSFTFSKPGYETTSRTIAIKPGTTFTLDLTLTAIENNLKAA